MRASGQSADETVGSGGLSLGLVPGRARPRIIVWPADMRTVIVGLPRGARMKPNLGTPQAYSVRGVVGAVVHVGVILEVFGRERANGRSCFVVKLGNRMRVGVRRMIGMTIDGGGVGKLGEGREAGGVVGMTAGAEGIASVGRGARRRRHRRKNERKVGRDVNDRSSPAQVT